MERGVVKLRDMERRVERELSFEDFLRFLRES
jgi:hypothetical protein